MSNELKILPQAIELEDAVLGAILIQSNCLSEVVGIIFPDAFYSEINKTIYKSILCLYDDAKKVDVLTVVDQLKKEDKLEFVGGAYHITRLTNEVVSVANVEAHCRIVMEKFLAREMIRICGDALQFSYSDAMDIFDLYDKTDNDILNTQERVLGGMIHDMNFNAAKVHDEYETVKSVGVLGIQTGIKPIDNIFCGLVAPDLMVIAARPGQGKSSFAISLTHHISVVNKIPCAWFSLEMNATQITRRLVSMDSKISHEIIRQGKIHKDNEIKFYDSIERISKAPIFIEDKTSINIRTIRTRATILKKRNKIKFIVVDYLQLMEGVDTKNKNRENIVSDISRGLKNLARELDLPIIALSQLSRKVEERSDKMPALSDLRESGAIEQDADEVIFLMRPEYYEFTEDVQMGGKSYHVKNLCIGKGGKNRHGGCQNFAMWFDAPTMQFSTHLADTEYKIERDAPPNYQYDNPF